MAESYSVEAVLTAKDQNFSSTFANAEKTAGTFGSKLKSGLAAGAAVGIGAVTALGVATVAAGKKMWQGINATAQYGDNVDKMSQKIGISAEAYQKWDYVMKRAGTSIDNMKMGMKTLSKQAESGSDAFRKLGISQEKVKSLSQEDLFSEVVKGLSNMEAGTERAALASELLGRAGADLGPLLNEGSAAIEEQMDIAEKYGMVMSDEAVKASAAFEDSLTTLQMTATGLKNRLMSEFLPAVTQVTDGLAKLFTGDMSGLDDIGNGISNLVSKIAEIAPKVLEVGGSIVLSLVTAITQNLPQLMTAGTSLVLTLLTGVIQNLPQLLTAGVQSIATIIQGLAQAMPTLIPAMVQAVVTMVEGLINNIDLLISASVQLIGGIVTGLINALPQLMAAMPKLIDTMVRGLIANINLLIACAGKLIQAIVKGIIQNLPQILQQGIQIVSKLISGILQVAGQLPATARNLVSQFRNVWSGINWGSIGSAIVRGIANGIKSGASAIASAAKSAAKNALNAAKSLLGIHSPSRVFRDEVGKNVALGFAEGIADNMGYVYSAMDSLSATAQASFAGNLSESYDYNSRSTIIVPLEIDGKEFARATAPYNIAENNKAQARANRAKGWR